jgi:hypothetical protein
MAYTLDPIILQETLENNWRGIPARFGFEVRRLNEAQPWTAAAHADEEYNVASCFKVHLAAEVLRQAEQGKLKLGTRILLQGCDRVSNSEITDVYPDGSGLTVRALLDAMIEVNDNTAAETLTRLVGIGALRELVAGLGLKQTRFPDSLRQMIAYSYGLDEVAASNERLETLLMGRVPDPQRQLDIYTGPHSIISTPRDLASFYQSALGGELFEKPQTLRWFKEVMHREDARQKTRWPAGVTCYRKGGNLELAPYYATAMAGGVMGRSGFYTFAFCLNCECHTSETLEEYLELFRASINQVFQLFRDSSK